MVGNDSTKASGRNAGFLKKHPLVIAGVLVAVVTAVSIWWPGASPARSEAANKWKVFVSVDGQPEPVPAEWVSTPEGRFAHSIKLPEPLPDDSGYREGMTGKEYWEQLCKTEAGEFIYRTVDNVEGFYFMRPPNRPSDDDMKDRYKLEAPDLERVYQHPPTAEERSKSFVRPPWATFRYVEEQNSNVEDVKRYLRMYGYNSRKELAVQTEKISTLKSQYGLIWRGIRRPHDRELAIAGSEWIVIDIQTSEVLAVQRNFALTGWVKRTSGGIWWLTAPGCANTSAKNLDLSRYYDFVTMVLQPLVGEAE